jgi:hypothetical protein
LKSISEIERKEFFDDGNMKWLHFSGQFFDEVFLLEGFFHKIN